MDITSLMNVTSGAIKESATASGVMQDTKKADGNLFGSILNSVIDNLNTTNSYLSDYENEQLKFAMGETQNSHDLTIALDKASTALQYTVAVRDKFMEAYKEIMNMQI